MLMHFDMLHQICTHFLLLLPLSWSLLFSSIFLLGMSATRTLLYILSHPIYIIMAELHVNILSVNCQGIGLLPKRTDVLSYLKGKIVCRTHTFSPGVHEKS